MSLIVRVSHCPQAASIDCEDKNRQGNTRVGGAKVKGDGVRKSLWHKAELGDVKVAKSLTKLDCGLTPEESNIDDGVCTALYRSSGSQPTLAERQLWSFRPRLACSGVREQQ